MLPDQRPLDYILDPRNNVGLHPSWEWGKLEIGTHTVDYSELSSGNVPIFGLGFDLNPGKFRFAASYGYANTAIEINNGFGIQPEYRQRICLLYTSDAADE